MGVEGEGLGFRVEGLRSKVENCFSHWAESSADKDVGQRIMHNGRCRLSILLLQTFLHLHSEQLRKSNMKYQY